MAAGAATSEEAEKTDDRNDTGQKNARFLFKLSCGRGVRASFANMIFGRMPISQLALRNPACLKAFKKNRTLPSIRMEARPRACNEIQRSAR